jgi:hypothetical protein
MMRLLCGVVGLTATRRRLLGSPAGRKAKLLNSLPYPYYRTSFCDILHLCVSFCRENLIFSEKVFDLQKS